MSETPSSPKINSIISYEEVKSYYQYRVPSCSLLGGVIGGTAGYFIGDISLRLGSAWTVAGGVLGIQFFTTTLLLKLLRSKDDEINYGLAGGITTLTSIKYLELSNIISRSPLSSNFGVVVVGVATGMLFKFTEGVFYDFLRDHWISRRHYLKHISRPIIVIPKQGTVPRHLMGKVPPLPEGVTFQTPEDYEEQKKRWGFK